MKNAITIDYKHIRSKLLKIDWTDVLVPLVFIFFIIYGMFSSKYILLLPFSMLLAAFIFSFIKIRIDVRKLPVEVRMCDDYVVIKNLTQNSFKISLCDIVAIYEPSPKTEIGHVSFIKNSKIQKLLLDSRSFYPIKDLIIRYFKHENIIPTFIYVTLEMRSTLRNKVSLLEFYYKKNKKEKIDKILNDFWSKHKLEEFE